MYESDSRVASLDIVLRQRATFEPRNGGVALMQIGAGICFVRSTAGRPGEPSRTWVRLGDQGQWVPADHNGGISRNRGAMEDKIEGHTDGLRGRLETRVWLRMLACGNIIEGELSNRLRDDFGTTLARFDVLAEIARPPSGPTMSELSQRLMVTKGNINFVIGRLENEQLVARRRDPEDARMLRVHLTAKGRRLIAAMIPAHNAMLAELLRKFDRDRLEQLDKLLGELRAALREVRIP